MEVKRGNPFILAMPERPSFDAVVRAGGQEFPFRCRRLTGLEALSIQDIGNKLIADFVPAKEGADARRTLPPIGDDFVSVTPAACYLVATVLAAQVGEKSDPVFKPWSEVEVFFLFHAAYEQMMDLVHEIGKESEEGEEENGPFEIIGASTETSAKS